MGVAVTQFPPHLGFNVCCYRLVFSAILFDGTDAGSGEEADVISTTV